MTGASKDPYADLPEPAPGLVWMIHAEVKTPVQLPPAWLDREDYSAVGPYPTSPAAGAPTTVKE